MINNCKRLRKSGIVWINYVEEIIINNLCHIQTTSPNKILNMEEVEELQ